MGFQQITRSGRRSLGIWVAIVALMVGSFTPSGRAGATTLGTRPADLIIARAELVVRAKLISAEPLFYIEDDRSVNTCALKMKATALEVLKGGLKQGATIAFLAGDSIWISESLTSYYRPAIGELTDPDVDLYPTEFLVFLTSGSEGLDQEELERIDSYKSSYRSCVVRKFQWGGYHTVFFDPPRPFDRWVEKQFGGKWVSVGYDFPDDWERLEWREVQFGPTPDIMYGVLNWTDVRPYLLRLIQERDR